MEETNTTSNQVFIPFIRKCGRIEEIRDEKLYKYFHEECIEVFSKYAESGDLNDIPVRDANGDPISGYACYGMTTDGERTLSCEPTGYLRKDNIRRRRIIDKQREAGRFAETVDFNIKCRMTRRWANELMSFLKYMEWCGKIGHSCSVSFLADGDGDFRPKFECDLPGAVVNLDPVSVDRKTTSEAFFDAG